MSAHVTRSLLAASSSLPEPSPSRSFAMSGLESEYALGFSNKVFGMMLGIVRDDPRLDYELHNLQEQEEAAWKSYNINHIPEIEGGIEKIGFSGGVSYGHSLQSACHIKGISQNTLDARMGGVVKRYFSKWVVYHAIDQVFVVQPKSPMDLQEFKERATQMVTADVAKEFPGVNPELFDIAQNITKITDKQRASLAYSGSRKYKCEHINLTAAVDESLSMITQGMRKERDAYVATYLPEWEQFCLCKNELYYLRLLDYALKAREELDAFSEELGEEHVDTEQFFIFLKAEVKKDPSKPSYLAFECNEMEMALREASASDNEELEEAITKWLGLIQVKPISSMIPPYLPLSDIMRSASQAPASLEAASVSEFRELLEGKKRAYDTMRQELPDGLLNQEENFIKEVCRAKSKFTDCLHSVDEYPNWFIEHSDRMLQVAYKLAEGLSQIEEGQKEYYLENILKLWMTELNRVHDKAVGEDDMERFDLVMKEFESSLLPSYVQDVYHALDPRDPLESQAKVIESGLECVSSYYYGIWLRNRVQLNLVLAYSDMVTNVFTNLPGPIKNKVSYVSRSVQVIPSGFQLGTVVASKVFYS